MSNPLEREIAELRERLYELELRASGLTDAADEMVAGERDMLLVQVGATRAAFEVAVVDEVVPAAALSALPETQPWILGLLNLRAEVIPVLDVAARVARRQRTLDLEDRIVVVKHGGNRVGLVVQAVFGVETLTLVGDGDEVKRLAKGIPFAPYLAAIVPDDAGLIAVLSVAKLVSTSQVPVQESAAEDGAGG